MGALRRAGPGEPRVAVDIGGSWAREHVARVLALGIMEVYPNHTFQPAAGMTRGEFAAVMTRVLNIVAARAPQAAQGWRDARLSFADVRPGHTLYLAISRAVASGVMQPVEGQMFGISRPMTGIEAVQVVERLTRLADRANTGEGAGQRGGRRD